MRYLAPLYDDNIELENIAVLHCIHEDGVETGTNPVPCVQSTTQQKGVCNPSHEDLGLGGAALLQQRPVSHEHEHMALRG